MALIQDWCNETIVTLYYELLMLLGPLSLVNDDGLSTPQAVEIKTDLSAVRPQGLLEVPPERVQVQHRKQPTLLVHSRNLVTLEELWRFPAEGPLTDGLDL